MKTRYEKNQEKFIDILSKMKQAFWEENRIVAIGDRVVGRGCDKGKFEITSIEFFMVSRGSWGPYRPMLKYFGKPVSKKDKIMHKRIEIELCHFIKDNGEIYTQEHVYDCKKLYL